MRISKKLQVSKRIRTYHLTPSKLDFSLHDEGLFDKNHKYFYLTIYTKNKPIHFQFYYGSPYKGFDVDKYNEEEFNKLNNLLKEDESICNIERTNRYFL